MESRNVFGATGLTIADDGNVKEIVGSNPCLPLRPE
jgi:hypothetical protein